MESKSIRRELMGNYRDLQDRILDEIRRPESYRQRVKNAIQDAIQHYTGEVFWFNEQEAFRDTVPGREYYDLPAGRTPEDPSGAPEYTQTGSLRIQLGPDDHDILNPRSNEWMEEHFTERLGRPTDFSIVDNRYRLHEIPDAIYRIYLYYVKAQEPLIKDSDENDWTNVAERLIRARAKAYMYTNIIRDLGQAQVMATLVKDEYEQLKKRHVGYVFTVTRTKPWL